MKRKTLNMSNQTVKFVYMNQQFLTDHPDAALTVETVDFFQRELPNLNFWS